MKNLKLLLLVLTVGSIIGCGKKNDVTAPTTTTPVAAVPVVNSSVPKTDLINKINANSFRQITYNYFATKNLAQQSDCKVKWLVFYICANGSGNNSRMDYVHNGQTISNNEFGTTFATIQTALRDKINQAVEVKNYNNGYYGIKMSNNDIYYFNLNVPLVFNPIQKVSIDGSGYNIY